MAAAAALVIGKDIPIRQVCDVLTFTPSSLILSPKLLDVALTLGASSLTVDSISCQIPLKLTTWGVALLNILEKWVEEKSQEATLDKLAEALKQNDLCDSADVLVKRFADIQQNSDMGPSSKKCKQLKDTLPLKLPYYVNRTMRTRNVLTNMIFEQKGKSTSDKFLFSGVTLIQLSGLVKNFSVTNSAEELMQEEIIGKFMVLNNQSHFERICGKTSKNVHWLSMGEDNKLRWIRSKAGSVEFLQRFVDEDRRQDVVKKDEFLEKLDHSSNMPICLVDSPGMGKSILLAEIGRRLEAIFPTRDILFILLPEFVKEVHETHINLNLHIEEAIKTALEKLACTDEASKIYFRDKLTCIAETVSLELLLDGLDEVDNKLQSFALKILELILPFRNVRVWVTSRPHLLQKLETTLNVLGFNICPFELDDQLHSITSFWALSEVASLDASRLWEFAKKCLKDLHSRMNSKEADIAGIPLQCMIIAEIFKEQAHIFAEPTSATVFRLPPNLQFHSIGDLYRLFLERKLEKYKKLSGNAGLKDEEILTMHFKLAFDILFPLENFIAATVNIDVLELFKFGLVEAVSLDFTLPPRFLHRTFAEYLVSSYITDRLKNKSEWTVQLGRFLGENLLRHEAFRMIQSESTSQSGPFITQSHKFTLVFPVFLNCLIANMAPVSKKVLEMIDPVISPVRKELLHACVQADCASLCKFLVELSTGKAPEGSRNLLFDEGLVLISAAVSSLPVFKFVLSRSEGKCSETSIKICWRILKVAVEGGRFQVVQFMLNEGGLRKKLQNFDYLPNKVKELLHECVMKRENESEESVERRLETIRLLVSANRSFLEHKNIQGKTPLLLSRGDIRATLELIKLGANCIVWGKRNGTIIHSYDSKVYTKEEYHSLITKIKIDDVRKLIGMKWKRDKSKTASPVATPLERVLEHFDPLPETVRVFKEAGQNFNYLNNDGYSILATAIKYKRNECTLRELVECGADVNWEEKETGKTLLHLAAEHGNCDALQFLAKEKSLDVNGRDSNSFTPLRFAKEEATKKLLKALGGSL